MSPRATELRQRLLLLGLAVLLLLAWRSPLLYPFRILVVLFHELGHAALALLTGGRVVSISLSPQEGGLCATAGGNRFLVLNGGYLGSLVFGLLLLALSREERRARALAFALGLLVLLASLLWLRPLLSFGFLYGLVAGAGILLLARRASPGLCWGFLRLLGTFSVLYALLDVRDDVLSGWAAASGQRTDADLLAELTGLPALFWGLAWIGLGLFLLWRFRHRLV